MLRPVPLIVLWIIPVALAAVVVSYIFWGPLAATITGAIVLVGGVVRVRIHRSVVDALDEGPGDDRP